jgi:hypothetical protein
MIGKIKNNLDVGAAL